MVESGTDPLESRQREFEAAVPWGKDLITRLRKDDAELTYVRSAGADYVWLLRARLPAYIQEGFGTAPEVLIMAVRGQVQARDLEKARNEIYQASFRLDLDLLIISDDTPELAARLERLPGRWGQTIAWPPSSHGFTPLIDQFIHHLRRFDIFEEKKPVRGRQVIGRQEEVSDIITRVENADCIGVFGLRKVGKTSVVRAVTDSLDPISTQLSLPTSRHAMESPSPNSTINFRAIVAWLDVQRIFERSQHRLLENLVEAVEKRLSASQLLPKLPQTSNPLDKLDKLLKHTLYKIEVPLCLVLDEYDFMFEGSGGQPPIPGVHQLFQLLRGWSQETRLLSVIVIGRDPSFFQYPEMGGFPNPMLGWAAVRWIGPLHEDKAPELLRKLGRRVGLNIGPKTIQTAAEWTGGHPLLHRQFGSALFEFARERNASEGHIATDPYCDQAITRFQERDSVRDVCSEIIYLLRTRYFAAYKLVMEISQGLNITEAVAHNDGWSSNAALTLRNFGILQGSSAHPRIPKVITTYAKAFEPMHQRPSPQQGSLPTNAIHVEEVLSSPKTIGPGPFPPLNALTAKAPQQPTPQPPRSSKQRRRRRKSNRNGH